MTEAGASRLIRQMMRQSVKAALSTSHAARDGWPYGSLVTVACDVDAAPLLLLSDLSDHVKNLSGDSRASLLYDATGDGDEPLRGGRVTVLGRLIKTRQLGHRARFLARHPTAASYASFADFNFYRMRIEAAHLVGGFGKIAWLSAGKLRVTPFDRKAWAAGDAQLAARLNSRYVALVAAAIGRRAATNLEVRAVDPDGLDISVGQRLTRLEFTAPAATPRAVVGSLKRLAAAR